MTSSLQSNTIEPHGDPCPINAQAVPRPDLLAIEKATRDASVGHMFSPLGEALRLAADTIGAQRLSQIALHRRVQEAEAATTESAMVAKAQSRARWATDWAHANFTRMMRSHEEVKRIYDHIRRARPDGCDDYGYHSVMDSRADGGQQVPGAVWANRYKSKRGGIVSVRPSEVIGELIDELLQLRATLAKAEPHP